ncbi:MAG: ketopantoate reductase family protein [Alphaproteobacteria bacterium]|nr:ketopantoate reductase family protein [Alphaproteobacteria bacterium]
MARILIWGAGAIGGTAGAYLKRAGHDITFVDVVEDHVKAIRTSGLKITGPVDQFTVVAPAFMPDEVEGTWDMIFLAVKAQHTEAATRALMPHLSQDGYVLSLQNGLCETIIAPIIGRDRTVGAFINYSTDWIAPGEVMFGSRGAVVLGELHGRTTERLMALHGILSEFEPGAIITANISGYLWGKLGYGAMLFAQALGAKGIADCLARPEMMPVWRAIGREVNEVTLAEGITPMGFNGYDPGAFMPNAPRELAEKAIADLVIFNRPSAKTHSGIWRDLFVRKRTTEVDVQIKPIADIGAKHGIATPTISKLVALIHEIEAGTRPMSDDNLLELLPQ